MLKSIKLFLMIGVILFSIFGAVGCSNEEIKEEQETTQNDDLDHKTGPVPFSQNSYSNFMSFDNYFKKINMNNNCLVSFNLDDIKTMEIHYYYVTDQKNNTSFLDTENYVHYFKYEFYSKKMFIGSGVDNVSYKIECYDIILIKNCNEDDIVFKLASEKDAIIFFDLLLNDECIMKIKINMEENYVAEDLEKVVSLLKNNIMIIK